MTHGKKGHLNDTESTYPTSWNAHPANSNLHQPSLSNSQHGITGNAPFFPPAPLPLHPVTFTHIPYAQPSQNFFQTPTPNLNQPAFNLNYPIHWQAPQWNIPQFPPQTFPFTNKTPQQNITTKENPFGTQPF